MNPGKILVADSMGDYLLKLSGDVRVTLCGTLNRHIETIFGSKNVKQVVVDMLDADCLDSTTLGLLAKLGLHCRKQYGINLQVFCENASILRTLEHMSFDEIFDIFQDVPEVKEHINLHNIGIENVAVDDIRRQVLEAHKLLIEMNPENSADFTDLISALESDS
ncbi:MAG: STAS domain-containing protein [Porticoccaceae bacterium]|nr:STAS domain-containing protein [Porticoccaceae bacterium]